MLTLEKAKSRECRNSLSVFCNLSVSLKLFQNKVTFLKKALNENLFGPQSCWDVWEDRRTSLSLISRDMKKIHETMDQSRSGSFAVHYCREMFLPS